jgi:very-short-patch-repair endonuclease
LVIHQGRAGVIEVDGATHHGKASHDRSRDRRLEDAGICYVDRLCADWVSDPEEAVGFAERFIERLVT